LLRFQELWTQPPDELVEAGLPGLMSRGDDLLQEDGMGGPEPVALPVETDSRDWRARHPPPPLQAVVQQQQLQRTPNKQRNDRNERNERDRNENNSRGFKDQTDAQASLPLHSSRHSPRRTTLFRRIVLSPPLPRLPIPGRLAEVHNQRRKRS